MASSRDEIIHAAALAACRNIWKVYGGSYDEDCPDRETWLREELEALEPAIAVFEEAGVLDFSRLKP